MLQTVNQRILDRYHRYIESIKANTNDRRFTYMENHHIVPRCIGGNDSPENMILLSLREHFIAHLLLANAYPNHIGIVSAFIQMANKNAKENPRVPNKNTTKVNSRLYQKLKTHLYSVLLPEIHADKVRVKDDAGNILEFTKDEYEKVRDIYPFHTRGMVSCMDRRTGSKVYITSAEYQRGKTEGEYYVDGEGKVNCIDSFTGVGVSVDSEIYRLDKYKGTCRYYIDRKTNNWVRDNTTGETAYMLFEEYEAVKGELYAVGLTKRKRYSVVKDFSGVDYSSKVGTFSVTDQITGERMVIDHREYDPSIHYTSTRGKVIVRTTEGKCALVSKEEFENGEYDSVTKGYTTVRNKATGNYEFVTNTYFAEHRDEYEGPCSGKVNAVNKVTGERSQISKVDFDNNKDIWVGAGNKKLLFKCRNLLTGREKNINIYEWDKVRDLYEVIDILKFSKLKEYINVQD